MKLVKVSGSAAAWGCLAKLKKNPKLAYWLMKYEKKVHAELKAIEEFRTALVYQVAGQEPPAPGEVKLCTLGVGTPELIEFHKQFTEFLDGESELEWFGTPMEELIEALGAAGNVLSEEDLEVLEPFFTAPAEAAPAAANT